MKLGRLSIASTAQAVRAEQNTAKKKNKTPLLALVCSNDINGMISMERFADRLLISFNGSMPNEWTIAAEDLSCVRATGRAFLYERNDVPVLLLLSKC
jgi:hypothetical protein